MKIIIDNLTKGIKAAADKHVPAKVLQRIRTASWQSVLITISGMVGLYLLLMPIFPQLWFYMRQLTGSVRYDEQVGEFQSSLSEPLPEEGDIENIPDENMLYVPSIGISVQIVEGQTEDALNRGAWRRPLTSTPDKGGNTVITGHRFKYLPPSNLTFYHLDKIELGDEVVVYWDKVRYDYTVTNIFEVDPSQVEVEANTAQSQLTLYTCTPLWTAKRRLVVVAEPDVEENVPLQQMAE